MPYRDSKLTRILQNSLGGNARTAIICTISPALSHVEQTKKTLSFAMSAKEVTNCAKVNMVRHLVRCQDDYIELCVWHPIAFLWPFIANLVSFVSSNHLIESICNLSRIRMKEF